MQAFYDIAEFTSKDLKILFSGTYQLKQAISYLAEMLVKNIDLNVSYYKEHENLIKILVRSRHINKKTYKCYVEYKPNYIGYASIQRYCCECPNGKRTVGCCSHVAAVIYYLLIYYL